MHIKKYAAVGATIALMAAPAFVSAQSASTTVGVDLQGQVKTLMQQIQALQEQLKALLSHAGSSTKDMMGGMGMGGDTNRGQMGKMICIELNRNLKPGMQGDDVKQIQQMLSDDQDSDFHGSVTGFFGPLTAKAFAKFQVNNGIASSSDGTAGPRTRAFFERRCGKGLDGEHGNQAGGQGQGGKPGMPVNMMFIAGTVASFDGTTLTVTGPDNQSKSFTVNASTSIEVKAGTSTPATSGTSANLTVGAKVMVQSTAVAGATNPVATHIRVGDFPPMMDDHNGLMQKVEGMMGQMMGGMPWGSDGHGPNNR